MRRECSWATDGGSTTCSTSSGRKANRKHCGHCGEKIQPHHQQRFDTGQKDVVLHEHCFWGRAISMGWSYLAKPGHRPPELLALPCGSRDCDEDIEIDTDVVWYERIGGHYLAYHARCTPSAILD